MHAFRNWFTGAAGTGNFFFRYIHMNRHALSIIEIFDLCPDFRLQPTLLQYITLGGRKKKMRQASRRLRSKKGRIEASRKPYCSYLHNYCRFIAFFSKCYCCVAKARTSSICRVPEQLGTLARRPQTQVWCSGSMKFRYETWRLRSGGVSCKAAWTGSRSRCMYLLSFSSPLCRYHGNEQGAIWLCKGSALGRRTRRGEEFVLSGGFSGCFIITLNCPSYCCHK